MFNDVRVKISAFFLLKYLRVPIFCRYFANAFGTQTSARKQVFFGFLATCFQFFWVEFLLEKKYEKKVAKNFGNSKICFTFALAFGTERQWRRNADDPWQHSIQTKQYNVSLLFSDKQQSITSKELYNNRQSFIYDDTILLI